jgi:hypothetical protein
VLLPPRITYGSQTLALQAAEVGLNLAVNLVQNFKPVDKDKHNFTGLLSLRGSGQEFPVSAADFISGTEMITAGGSQSGDVSLMSSLLIPATEANGHVLRDANGNPIDGASYSVRLIDDEPNPARGDPALKVPNFNPGSAYSESTGTDPVAIQIDRDGSGNGSVNGQVISLGNRNVSNSLVNTDTNSVTGSFLLTLNDGNAIGKISLYTWRQIKR